jgi:hypothetical protein
MKVVDLFCGLKGWSAPFAEAGHEVWTTDLDPRFDPTVAIDILELDPNALPWKPDIVLASPPCEGFTVMNIGKNWTRPDDDPPHQPKTDSARLAQRLVERTRELLSIWEPTFFVIENPVAKLRKLPVVADLERITVTYCRLGETNRKPTDLWGGFPPSLALPPPCAAVRGLIKDVDGVPYRCDPVTGEPCHVSAPRGSRTPGSIQGKTGGAVRAEIPRELALRVMRATAHDLDGLEWSRPGASLEQWRLF